VGSSVEVEIEQDFTALADLVAAEADELFL
jgi:hypothetical protein